MTPTEPNRRRAPKRSFDRIVLPSGLWLNHAPTGGTLTLTSYRHNLELRDLRNHATGGQAEFALGPSKSKHLPVLRSDDYAVVPVDSLTDEQRACYFRGR